MTYECLTSEKDYSYIDEKLSLYTDENYRIFNSRLIPGVNVLGVRMPVLRKYAKEIASGEWRGYVSSKPENAHEYRLLRGLVLGYVKTDEEELFSYIKQYIPLIDNWAICDCVCAGLKFFKKSPVKAFDFTVEYIKAEKEFEIRFGVVSALFHFCDAEHIDEVLSLFNDIKNEDYYVEMAVAWAVAAFYTKFPQKTKQWLIKSNLNKFTYNKALQKIIESRIPTAEQKEHIKKLRR